MEDLKQSDVAQLRPSQHLIGDSEPIRLVSASLLIKVTLHHIPFSFSLYQKIFRQNASSPFLLGGSKGVVMWMMRASDA